jgi:hypothetical protein
MEAVDYPTQIGGKPPGSWQAYVPVTFEVTILFAAVGCFVGLWFLCGLPYSKHPILEYSNSRRVPDDRLLISVEGDPAEYAEAAAALRACGALEITEVCA